MNLQNNEVNEKLNMNRYKAYPTNYPKVKIYVTSTQETVHHITCLQGISNLKFGPQIILQTSHKLENKSPYIKLNLLQIAKNHNSISA